MASRTFRWGGSSTTELHASADPSPRELRTERGPATWRPRSTPSRPGAGSGAARRRAVIRGTRSHRLHGGALTWGRQRRRAGHGGPPRAPAWTAGPALVGTCRARYARLPGGGLVGTGVASAVERSERRAPSGRGDPRWRAAPGRRCRRPEARGVRNLIHNRWRTLVPQTGTYTSPDPLHAASVRRHVGPQGYSYASGRPTVLTDPNGLLVRAGPDGWKLINELSKLQPAAELLAYVQACPVVVNVHDEELDKEQCTNARGVTGNQPGEVGHEGSDAEGPWIDVRVDSGKSRASGFSGPATLLHELIHAAILCHNLTGMPLPPIADRFINGDMSSFPPGTSINDAQDPLTRHDEMTELEQIATCSLGYCW